MNKITDLKIYKKLLSLLSAFTIMLTPISGLTEGEKEDSKTNETKVEEMIEEPEVYERKQMTMEEFDTRKMELRSTFLPIAREFGGKKTDIDALFFIANIDSCMDILDELMSENNDLKTKFPLFGNSSSRTGVIMYILDGFAHNNKLEVNLSEFVCDEKDREEIKPYCDLIVEIVKELIQRKPDKNTIKEFIDLFENRPTSLGNRGFLLCLVLRVNAYIDSYIQTGAPKKDVDKYVIRKNKDIIDFTIRDGVVLNKNSDNTTELLVYLYKQIASYLDDVNDELLEFDYNYAALQKRK